MECFLLLLNGLAFHFALTVGSRIALASGLVFIFRTMFVCGAFFFFFARTLILIIFAAIVFRGYQRGIFFSKTCPCRLIKALYLACLLSWNPCCRFGFIFVLAEHRHARTPFARFNVCVSRRRLFLLSFFSSSQNLIRFSCFPTMSNEC